MVQLWFVLEEKGRPNDKWQCKGGQCECIGAQVIKFECRIVSVVAS